MRTTISISDELLEEAKRISHERKTTLGNVIEDALRVALRSREKGVAEGPPRPLVTFRGKGVRPGVNVNDSSDLLRVMEE
ncbi:MAG: hypothetical protein JJU00_05000 [Opitutales bacterium]|nr:hypothetical protein [Opitutales bacterium]